MTKDIGRNRRPGRLVMTLMRVDIENHRRDLRREEFTEDEVSWIIQEWIHECRDVAQVHDDPNGPHLTTSNHRAVLAALEAVKRRAKERRRRA